MAVSPYCKPVLRLKCATRARLRENASADSLRCPSHVAQTRSFLGDAIMKPTGAPIRPRILCAASIYRRRHLSSYRRLGASSPSSVELDVPEIEPMEAGALFVDHTTVSAKVTKVNQWSPR